MRLAAEDYRNAAGEHIETARMLHEAGRHATAHYIVGLAVECILRAYRHRLGPEFDARHDLAQLIIVSGFREMVWRLGAPGRDSAQVALDVLLPRWRNNHRYLSEAGYRRFLKQAGFDRGIRGDFVKDNSRRMVEAATELVALGVRRWSR